MGGNVEVNVAWTQNDKSDRVDKRMNYKLLPIIAAAFLTLLIIETCSVTECFIRPANIEKLGYYEAGMVIDSIWWSFKDGVRRWIKGI